MISTEPNAPDFDESHTQGPDAVNFPQFYFHDSSVCQNRETRALLLTHLQYIRQILKGMLKVSNLRPKQSCILLIFPNNHLSQSRTLKLHTNLFNIHHQEGVTSL